MNVQAFWNVMGHYSEQTWMKSNILFDMDSITGISHTLLKYKDNENIEQVIDLKESAGIWWEKHHKETLLTKIMRKKRKCIYAGNKEFRIGGISYIELYTSKEQIRFGLKIPYTDEQSVLMPFREKWEEINIALHKEGYWLFDMNYITSCVGNIFLKREKNIRNSPNKSK